MDRLETMFRAQRELQLRSFNIPLESFMNDVDGRITYIKENVLALSDELHEALNEVGWKSWATSRHINEDGVKKELVDAFHFFMNLMLAAGMTTDELFEMYAKKRQINENRQLSSYDGVSTKMPCCGRAIEDVPFTEVRKPDGTLDFVQCVCTTNVPAELLRQVINGEY